MVIPRESAAKKLISVVQLGTIDYATGLCLQQRLIELRKDGRIGDVLLLLEHTPVITLGRNAKSQNILASPELLAQRGIKVFECDRGGDVTFHGPARTGQSPVPTQNNKQRKSLPSAFIFPVALPRTVSLST